MEAEARLRWFAETGDSRQWTGPNDDADAHAGCRADIFAALATAEARGYARGIERAAHEAATWPKRGPTWSGTQAEDTAARIRALAKEEAK